MEKNKKYNFALIQFTRGNVELATEINAYAIEDFECSGIEEFSLEEAIVDQILGERAYSGGDVPESLIDEVQAATINQETFTYKYFFHLENYEENFSDFVDFIKNHYSQLPLYTELCDFEDWNAEWKKFYSPIIVSERLEIIPEWLKDTRENPKAEKIYIYPGMGFGTGTHETTFLCLTLFDKIFDELKSDFRCLDFGCGSGILGIAALKTKKIPTVFCDIDKSALDNCMQNLALNFNGANLQGSELIIRDRFKPVMSDLIFANILENVLILEKEIILSSLKIGGYLIVSGLLNHQVDEILSQYKTLEKITVSSKNDWSAILFQRSK